MKKHVFWIKRANSFQILKTNEGRLEYFGSRQLGGGKAPNEGFRGEWTLWGKGGLKKFRGEKIFCSKSLKINIKSTIIR